MPNDLASNPKLGHLLKNILARVILILAPLGQAINFQNIILYLQCVSVDTLICKDERHNPRVGQMVGLKRHSALISVMGPSPAYPVRMRWGTFQSIFRW